VSGDLLHPKRCAYPGCTGAMDGQMLTCAPHFSLLEEALRQSVVGAWDELRRQQAAGNVRRAAREDWRRIAGIVVGQLGAVRLVLEEAVGHNLTAEGRLWRRAQRQLELEADELEAAAADARAARPRPVQP
jgi:hypothetical protein